MEESQFISTNNDLDLFLALNNMPEPFINELSDNENYMYLWTKSYMIKTLGVRYATGDFFHFPLSEWINEDFKSAINQILSDLKGFSDESPITINDTITMHHFLYSMHFKINLITDFVDGLIQVDANHLVDDENQITLYFIQKKL